MTRGLAYLFISQGVFLICGYVTHVFMARKLGPQDYGIFGFVISVLTWVEIFVYGSANLVVKYVQTWPDRFHIWRSLFFRVQCLINAAFFTPFIGLALAIGRTSERYGFLFPIAFLDLLFVGFYQLYSGYLNGFRLYTRQAVASALYSLSKACWMVALVYLGWKVKGALLGNVLASVTGLLVAYVLVETSGVISRAKPSFRKKGAPGKLPITRTIGESFLFALIPLMVNFIFSLDLWMVNFLVGGAEVGYYVSAGTLSRAIFLLFSSTFMASFPAMVSSFRNATTSERLLRLFRLSGDFFLGVALPFALALAVNGRQLAVLFFGREYIPAGSTISILSLAMFFITVYVFHIYVLYAAGEYAKAIRALLLVAGLDTIVTPVMVVAWGIRGAALATTLVSAIGFLLAHLSVR